MNLLFEFDDLSLFSHLIPENFQSTPVEQSDQKILAPIVKVKSLKWVALKDIPKNTIM
jgi:hypothetical protein